jgi:hypothetical protein
MPRYRLTKNAHVKFPSAPLPQIVKAGTEFDYDGIPGSTWIALDDEARAMQRLHCKWEILPNGLQARRRGTDGIMGFKY